MKVALMLHGQGRFFQQSYIHNKKNLLDKYDVDVYCHLVWDKTIERYGYVGRRKTYPPVEDTPKKIKELYKPKKMVITEDFYFGVNEHKLFNMTDKFKDSNCQHSFFTLCQLKGISEVSKLFEWSKYDFILRTRYDCGFDIIPNLHELDKSYIYAAKNDQGTMDDQKDHFIDLSNILPNDVQNFVNIFDSLRHDHEIPSISVNEGVWAHYLNKFNLVNRLKKLERNEYRLHCYD